MSSDTYKCLIMFLQTVSHVSLVCNRKQKAETVTVLRRIKQFKQGKKQKQVKCDCHSLIHHLQELKAAVVVYSKLRHSQ